jgi:hypothetical protein
MLPGSRKILLFLLLSACWSVSSFAHQICGVVLDFNERQKILVSGQYIFFLTAEAKFGDDTAFRQRQSLIDSLHATDRVCLIGLFPAKRMFMPVKIVESQWDMGL